MALTASLLAVTLAAGAWALWRGRTSRPMALLFTVLGFCLARTTMAPSIDQMLSTLTAFISNVAG